MRAYSADLRERVLAAVERGEPRGRVAEAFGVSASTIKRLVARRRADPEDVLAARRPPGRPGKLRPEEREALWAQLEANRDATVERHAELWNASRGTALSRWTVGRAIRRLGWTRKKRRWEPPSATSAPAPSSGTG